MYGKAVVDIYVWNPRQPTRENPETALRTTIKAILINSIPTTNNHQFLYKYMRNAKKPVLSLLTIIGCRITYYPVRWYLQPSAILPL
jgi:hypothetical protein